VKNEANFFNKVRNTIFKGKISPGELAGTKSLLDSCSKANWCAAHAAYALATAYHETASTMQPINEMGGPKYFTKLYDVTGSNPTRARANGNISPGDGVKYHGRGYVQLTWKNGYANAGKKLNIDLVNNPELALDSKIAADVLIRGMSEGWFRGVSCSSTMPSAIATKDQFTKARGIINHPSDDPVLIANYAMLFQEALQEGGW
jgi:putative chitinase